MSTPIYHDHDADLAIVQAKRLAFIGYGNQGAAQAQNLRDNGVSEMLIGNREESYKEAALASGFQVVSIPEAAAWCDVVFLHLRMIAHGYMKNSGACYTTIFFQLFLEKTRQRGSRFITTG